MKYEIFAYEGSGYQKLLAYNEWRVAVLNYTSELKLENLQYVECHLYTDEVFILLEGEASLIFARLEKDQITDFEVVKLEKNKVYNVKAGTYHTHILSHDCRLLIVEQEDTHFNNSPRYYLNENEKQRLERLV
jgi:hypothetical protein